MSYEGEGDDGLQAGQGHAGSCLEGASQLYVVCNCQAQNEAVEVLK